MGEYKCDKCNKVFYQKRYLSQHNVRIHQKNLTASKTKQIFKCNKCDILFDSYSNEKEHRKIHFTIHCGEENCDERFENLEKLRQHLRYSHKFEDQDKYEEKTFESHEDFSKWLAFEEEQTKSNFVLARGVKKLKSHSVYHHMCSRSGHYNSKSTGERQLKAQGSKKAGCHCTAQIILKEFKDHLVMQYFKIHYKHDFLLSHLSVSKEVKQNIAGKLLLGVKESRILKECMCHDYAILNNMCKHIHAVNLLCKKKETYIGPLQVIPSESSPIFKDANNSNDDKISSFAPTKESILNKINKLYMKTQMKSSIDGFVAQQIYDTLHSLEHVLDSDITNSSTFDVSKEPSNKKIIPQKRFFSTKKQKVKKQMLNKPSREEQLNAASSLLNEPIISISSNNDHSYT